MDRYNHQALTPYLESCIKQVWGCPIGGTLVRESWTTDGSGSTYIWGFLDSEYRCVRMQFCSHSIRFVRTSLPESKDFRQQRDLERLWSVPEASRHCVQQR